MQTLWESPGQAQLCHAVAVDTVDLAGDERSLLRCKESDQRGHLGRAAGAARWMDAANLPAEGCRITHQFDKLLV